MPQDHVGFEAMKKTNQLPIAMKKHIEEVSKKLASRPKLQKMYENCYPNTYETAIVKLEDGEYFVYTGDIPAMWPRDTAEEIGVYLPLTKESQEIRDFFKGVMKRQWKMILADSYANSFNLEPTGHHYKGRDLPVCNDWVWEEKYEIDTLCYPIRTAYNYYKQCGDKSMFEGDFVPAVKKIVDQWILEQNHMENSTYWHLRTGCRWGDTLRNNGKGYPSKYTGMTWQGFRPSDDAAKFHFSIPANMFAVVVLGYLEEINADCALFDDEFMAKIKKLKLEITHGIDDFGKVFHPVFGWIYAYETDGFGNYLLADDANGPSLMSIPYFGYTDESNPVYANTRKFTLSHYNPFFYEGKTGKGIGSPHTPDGYIWHMALAFEGMTTTSKEDMLRILDMFEKTDADTNLCHEGFDANDPTKYTRPWFSATNALFAEFVEKCLEKGVL